MRLHAEFGQEIDEVDFAGFLLFGGTELEDRRDTDDVVARPEEGLHDLLGCVVPFTEGSAIGIGVGEEDDTEMPEGQELRDLKLEETACGKPDVLGIELREDDCGFLGFH